MVRVRRCRLPQGRGCVRSRKVVQSFQTAAADSQHHQPVEGAQLVRRKNGLFRATALAAAATIAMCAAAVPAGRQRLDLQKVVPAFGSAAQANLLKQAVGAVRKVCSKASGGRGAVSSVCCVRERQAAQGPSTLSCL